jgi:hypothetical protein
MRAIGKTEIHPVEKPTYGFTNHLGLLYPGPEKLLLCRCQFRAASAAAAGERVEDHLPDRLD